MMCDACKTFMLDLLDKRTRRILALSHEEQDEERDAEAAQAHCFHLMELERILRGEPTSGIFDEYGAANQGRGGSGETPPGVVPEAAIQEEYPDETSLPSL